MHPVDVLLFVQSIPSPFCVCVCVGVFTGFVSGPKKTYAVNGKTLLSDYQWKAPMWNTPLLWCHYVIWKHTGTDNFITHCSSGLSCSLPVKTSAPSLPPFSFSSRLLLVTWCYIIPDTLQSNLIPTLPNIFSPLSISLDGPTQLLDLIQLYYFDSTVS